MYSRTIATYSFVDDLLKVVNHTQDSRQVSDAQVITAALLAMIDHDGNFERVNSRLALVCFLAHVCRARAFPDASVG